MGAATPTTKGMMNTGHVVDLNVSPNVPMIDHTETADFTTKKRRGNNNNTGATVGTADNTGAAVGGGGAATNNKSRSPSPKKKDQQTASAGGGAGLGDDPVSGGVAAMMISPLSPGRGGLGTGAGGRTRKKRTGAVNRFSALHGDDDSEDSSGDDSPTHEEEFTPMAKEVPVVKPRDIVPKEAGADLFGVLSLEFTQPPPATDPKARKWKKECTKVQVLFVSARTQKIEFEFSHAVRPTEFPQPNLKTAQALDEVLRQFDKFLKDNSMVPAYKTNKKGGRIMGSGPEREFAIVTCGPESLKQDFLQECGRKAAALTVCPAFKKWVDIQAILVEAYDLQKGASLQDALHKVCLEYEGSDDGKNVAKLLGCLIRDIPTRLIANQQAK